MTNVVLPPPRKPGRLTWAVVGRLCGRTFVAVTLLWLVALVGWPERHFRPFHYPARKGIPTERELARYIALTAKLFRRPEPPASARVLLSPQDGGSILVCHRDASLRVLWDALAQ